MSLNLLPWLHITTGSVDIRGNSVIHKELPAVDVKNYCGLCLYRNSSITTKAICKWGETSRPVLFFDRFSSISSVFFNLGARGAELRKKQHQYLSDQRLSNRLACEVVRTKIINSLQVLQRHSRAGRIDAFLKTKAIPLLTKLQGELSIESIRGIEGIVSRLYFRQIDELTRYIFPENFHFIRHSRRPPINMINALLSFLYSLLLRDVIFALISSGLEISKGFLHHSFRNRPALALDLMEEFRPWVVDRLAIKLISSKQIQNDDFIFDKNGVYLSRKGFKKVIESYESRAWKPVSVKKRGSLTFRELVFEQVRILTESILYADFRYSGALIK